MYVVEVTARLAEQREIEGLCEAAERLGWKPKHDVVARAEYGYVRSYDIVVVGNRRVRCELCFAAEGLEDAVRRGVFAAIHILIQGAASYSLLAVSAASVRSETLFSVRAPDEIEACVQDVTWALEVLRSSPRYSDEGSEEHRASTYLDRVLARLAPATEGATRGR